MAEAGIICTNEDNLELKFFHDHKTELLVDKNLSSFKDLMDFLTTQYPNNLLLRGYPTFNVPLNISLNSFAPQIHSAYSFKSLLLSPKDIKGVISI